jgi:GNAT superfamily N-acetyltransferase
MPIRFATLSDVPVLVEGAGRMHASTRFRGQPYDAHKVSNAFADLIEQRKSRYGFFIAENPEGQIVGALIGSIEQQILSTVCTANVMHLDVRPEARMGGYAVRLLRAFETWSTNRGAVEIALGVNGGAEMRRLGQFARRMGFRAIGENYVKLPQA